MAEFKISRILSLFNRGEVLVGDIIEGEVFEGALIRIPGDEEEMSLKIQSVEFLDHVGLKKIEIGLMLGNIQKDIRDKLKLLVGQVVIVK